MASAPPPLLLLLAHNLAHPSEAPLLLSQSPFPQRNRENPHCSPLPASSSNPSSVFHSSLIPRNHSSLTPPPSSPEAPTSSSSSHIVVQSFSISISLIAVET